MRAKIYGLWRRLEQWIEFMRELSARLIAIDKPTYLICVLTIIYGFVFSYYTVLRHYSFQTDAWDLGVYNQALWTTLFSRKFFYETPDILYNPEGTFFGAHFSPILILILPLYAIWPHPETLLIIQSWAIALSAIPLFKLALGELKSPTASILCTVAYLVYPPLHSVNWFDFHVQAFIPLFAFLTVYYMKRGCWMRYFASILLFLSTIEFAALIILFIALYDLLYYRDVFKRVVKGVLPSSTEIWKMRVPIFTLLLSLVWFFIAITVKQNLNPFSPPIPQYWTRLGEDFNIILANIFTNPNAVFTSLTFEWPTKFSYLLMLFAPISFISIFDPPSFLLTIPWLATSLLSDFWGYYSALYTQYPAFVVPFIFISAIYGIKRISAGNMVSIRRLTLLILFSSLLFFTNFSPLGPMSTYATGYRPLKIDEHKLILRDVIKLVPDGASILTQRDIFPHVSGNPSAYVYIPGAEAYFPRIQNVYKDLRLMPPPVEIDTILIDMKSPQYFGLPYPALSQVIPTIMSEGQWGTLASIDGIMLFKRDYSGAPLIFLPYEATYNYEQLIVEYGGIIDDPASSTGKVLHRTGIEKPDTTFWYGPYETIPPGKYAARFRLKVNSTSVGYILTIDMSYNISKNIVSSMKIYGGNFTVANTWQTFELEFYINKPVAVEFRGINATNGVEIYLDTIRITQIAPLMKSTDSP